MSSDDINISDASLSSKGGFSSYGVPFQENVIRAMMSDHRWAQQMSEVIDVSFFEKRYIQVVAQCIIEYSNKYKCHPSFDALVLVVKDMLRGDNDVFLKDSIVTLLKKIKTNADAGDLKYIKEKSLDFCRRQAMKAALEKSIDDINDGKYESVIGTMRKAIAVGTLPSVGHKFFDEIDARLTMVSRNCIPTGLPILDDKFILNGGLGSGELGIILATAGVGKSHFMVMLGANALALGKNIVHYTFELSEHYVGVRYDSNLCDVSASDVYENKEKIKLKYKETRKGMGRLFVKEYPTRACTMMTIRNHLERLEVSEGFKPDMLIVDYADVMRSSRAYNEPRHELQLIYEELRGLGQELNVPIWTGSQAHREAAKADIVGLENMSEAYSKAMIADFVVSLSRKPLEKATGVGRLFVAKNRMGKDGIVFGVNIDTARSKITVTDENALNVADAVEIDKEALQAVLKQKWKEIKKGL